jgi:hypothetical protein
MLLSAGTASRPGEITIDALQPVEVNAEFVESQIKEGSR